MMDNQFSAATDAPLTGADLARWCYNFPNLAARVIEGLRHDAQAVRGPTEPLQCLRCGTVDAFGPVSKRDPSNG